MATGSGKDGTKGSLCTPEELTEIIEAPCGGMAMLPNTHYDEVYPGIYIGDE